MTIDETTLSVLTPKCGSRTGNCFTNSPRPSAGVGSAGECIASEASSQTTTMMAAAPT